MTTNSQLSTIEPKKQKLSKQLGQEQTREMEITWRVISWDGEGKNGRGNVQGIRSINGRYKIDRGKSRIVWEILRLICMFIRIYKYDPWT